MRRAALFVFLALRASVRASSRAALVPKRQALVRVCLFEKVGIPPEDTLGVIYGEMRGALWGDPLGESLGGSLSVTFVTFVFFVCFLFVFWGNAPRAS